tara:strand:- start:53 stop:241 length:189 start_codon:yes stop_codon:yes gene_type:complete
MKTEQKSELRKAYDRVDTLKLKLNANQSIELSNILCDLATNQFQRGLDRGFEIWALRDYTEM